jgi:rsbT co-antagonist protein RsbR
MAEVARSGETGAGASVGELLELYEITPNDLERVRRCGEPLLERLDEHVDAFYGWLERQTFFGDFFADPEILARVKVLQDEYWRLLLTARVDEDYLRSRQTIGATHARIGLPPQAYLSAMNALENIFSDGLAKAGFDPSDLAEGLRALGKLLRLDSAIIIEEFTRITGDLIGQQSKALLEMSTPVTAIWQHHECDVDQDL